MQPRPYQQEAVNAIWRHLSTRDDAPCAVLPTGAGKTIVLAILCRDAVTLWSGRVLLLAHVKELLEQSADKIRTLCPTIPIGLYSAGLKRRDTTQPVILGGIQSVHDKACELGAFDLVIVDEAHLIPPDGEGMYQSFLRDLRIINPHVRVIGLTATDYRLGIGRICTPTGVLNHVCYEVSVKELIKDGYLCPLISKGGIAQLDEDGLHVRHGEFVASQVEAAMDTDELVESACREIIERTAARKAVLIFAAGVEHGRHVVRVLAEQHGQECGFITGQTLATERAELIARFKGDQSQTDLFAAERKPLKYLCNVNVLTTGFDAPNVDCVVLLRPTLSPGLYYQMVGRGFRLHPDKKDCLILDYGGNVKRHGPVDAIQIKPKGAGTGAAPGKECPECQSLIAAGCATCPDCGYEFPPSDHSTHAPTAHAGGVLTGQATNTRYEVQDVHYAVHTKRGSGPDTPRTLRVDYRIAFGEWKSEWICLEHAGFARTKAVAWWQRRCIAPAPTTIEEAVEIADNGGLATPRAIIVRSVAGEEFDRIVAWDLGPIPDADMAATAPSAALSTAERINDWLDEMIAQNPPGEPCASGLYDPEEEIPF